MRPHSQYVSAVRTRRVPERQLLPPKFPFIRLSFRCDAFSRKLHRHCPGNGTWEVEMKRTFESEGNAIVCLVALKNLFWCTHCERGLFFSPLSTASHVLNLPADLTSFLPACLPQLPPHARTRVMGIRVRCRVAESRVIASP